MKDKEIREAVLQAFTNSEYKWRTARGISKDTNIPIQRVAEFLEKSKDVVRAKKANSKGQALYSLRETVSREKSFVDHLVAKILNQPE
jgi:hypothetical protein